VLDLRGAGPRSPPARGARGPAGRAWRRSPHTWGFEENTAPLAQAGLPFWVAPGTSAWDSLVGRIDNAVGNLADAAEVGRARGARGYLITDWGDNGHLQPPSVSFGPILYGGAVSWGRDANAELDVATLLDRYAFDNPRARLGDAIVTLGRQWSCTGIDTANGSPLQAALLPSTVSLAASGTPDAGAVRDVLARIDQAIDDIGRAEPGCADGALVVAELVQAARLARHGAWRLLARVADDAPSVGELRADLTEAIEDQRTAWLARARPGGLADSVSRLERTLEEYDPA
jgi:hexosaminidase